MNANATVNMNANVNANVNRNANAYARGAPEREHGRPGTGKGERVGE